MVSGLACRLPGALASTGRLLSMFIFAVPKMASQKKRFLLVILLVTVALVGVYFWTSLPLWSTRTKGLMEELRRVCAAQLETQRNWHTLLAEQTQKRQLLPKEVAKQMEELNSAKKLCQDVQEANQAAPSKVYVTMSNWALKSSGATIDTQRTSETYICRETWQCRVVAFFHTANPPDVILQPDVSPGNCWSFQGHQGQVVIRLPARVHPTAITLQHIYKEMSPSERDTSAPRDVAVFGVDTDGKEEVLLVTFTYNVTTEAIQTFPLKNAPFPRAFSRVKFFVKSNWGNPLYTCIYRVRVHGVMAKAESLD
uniref:SUN domain-containing protein n=1 Tax=Otus sunia TaxID=257818 RepID=A0A8C8BC72_9STRI